MYIVRQHDRSTCVETILEELYAVADRLGALVSPIKGVDVRMHDVVTKLAEGLERKIVGTKVRRAHVCWMEADYVVKSRFQKGHLRDNCISFEGGEVRMGPAERT